MAAASRTTMLRQVRLLSSSTRTFSTTTQPLRLLRPAPTVLPKQLLVPSWSAAARYAPFSTSSQRNILPAGPQIIEGGVNEPAPVPKPNPLHGSYHWTAERLMSAALVPLTMAPFAAGSINPTLDALLIFGIIVHSHIGFQSIVIDYIPIHKHPQLRKAFMWALNLATLIVGIGFYEFETNDVGVTEAVKRLWHAGESNDATIGKTDSLSSLGHDGKLKHLK